MGVPNVFGSATTSIPLSQLDQNFNTTATLGNAAIGLGNVTTTVGNLTLTNVNITSGTINAAVTQSGFTGNSVIYSNTSGNLTTSANMTFNGTALTLANDASISGLTVGKGGSAVSTNTALGVNALNANTSGSQNVAVGYSALTANTTGNSNIGIGRSAMVANTTGQSNIGIGGTYNANASLQANTTGSFNVAVGEGSLSANTTASNNTAVGYQAGYSNTTGERCAFFGYQAGNATTVNYAQTMIGFQAGLNTTGANNTFVGYLAGNTITTGAKNTIIGAYSGNAGGLDIRTASNYIVLSDGDGNPRAFIDNTGTLLIGTNGNTGSNNKLVVDSSATSWNVVSRTLVTSGNSYCGMLASFGAYSPNNTSSFFFQGSDTTTQRFQVYSNGGIANYSANNVNLSDKTLKKDITLAPSYLDKLCQIPVKTYLYNDQTDSNLNLGVIAQDVQAICPELVGTMDIGEIDSPNIKLAIYETDLKYAMLKAIQELKAEFDAYKATHP